MTPFIRGMGLSLVLVALSGCNTIFNGATCKSPVGRNPPQSLVSVFVVPFEASSSSAIAEKAAEESARLLKVESIKASAGLNFTSFTLLNRGSFDRPCDAQRVAEAVSESQHKDDLRSDSVVVWGIVAQRDDELISQLYSTILWHDADSGRVMFDVTATPARTVQFTAQFPDLIMTFPQKLVGTSVNGEFLVDAEGRGIPRSQPNRGANAADLPSRFRIGERRNGWIELQVDDSKSIWLDAEPVRGRGNERLFPETDYFAAFSAFVKGRGVGTEDPRTRTKLTKLLNDYEVQYGQAPDDDSRTLLAMVHLMLAFHEFPVTNGPASGVSTQARDHVYAAARLLPNNAEVANVAALASLGDCCSGRDASAGAAKVQAYFDKALAADPADETVLRNLESWYALLVQQSVAPQGMTRDQVRARHVEILDRLRGGR